MTAKKAFTLVELLVVIAIIALLMSILMPALTRVRKQARSALCQTKLKQWCIVFSIYADDNNTNNPGLGAGVWTMTGSGGWWMNPLKSYYADPELKLCPAATKPYTEGGRVPFGAWTIPNYFYDIWDITKPVFGSYGPNGWIANAVKEDQTFGWFVEDWTLHWRSFNVQNAGRIPLMLDCSGFDGWPHHTDEPPQYEGEVEDAMVEEVKRFCINRHERAINASFMDCSVRKIGLKELWKLKWNRKCDLSTDDPIWPDWMRQFKDY
ncbi:MAG: type II secretion system protein [Planctomycetota bacterium]|jgi:prepilin-type N-terminal cleavage/methylation domain-containing protein